MKIPATYPILIVEDSDEDFEVIVWALKKLSIVLPIYRCTNGDEALDFLFHRGVYANREISPRPAVILLDLNLTATDGHEVLVQIKKDEMLKAIPVIVWTISSDPVDIEVSFKNGASSYILKPMNLDKLLETVEILNKYWFGMVALPEHFEV